MGSKTGGGRQEGKGDAGEEGTSAAPSSCFSAAVPASPETAVHSDSHCQCAEAISQVVKTFEQQNVSGLHLGYCKVSCHCDL